MATREIELKFSIPSTRVRDLDSFLDSLKKKGRLRLLGVEKSAHHDIYYDSKAFDLVRHYCSLRVRRKEKASDVLTFKRYDAMHTTAFADRLEIEGKYRRATLSRITRHVPWLLLLEDRRKPKREKKANLLADLGLSPTLEVRTERVQYALQFEDDLEVLLAYDRVRVTAGDKTRVFAELEAEYVGGDPEGLKVFDVYLRKQLKWLRGSRMSKYERGLRALKLWKRNKVLISEEVRHWRKRLEKVYQRFKSGYLRTILFTDIEELHGCRVALRQLITLLTFLDDGTHTSQPLETLIKRLRKIQKTLGKLRDRDVYLIYAGVDPALQLPIPEQQAEFLEMVKLERDRQRLQAVTLLPTFFNDSLHRQWQDFVSRRLRKFVRAAHVEDRYIALVHRFRSSYQALLRARATLGPAHPQTIKQLHKTRIHGKNVRYASQHLAFALPGNTKLLVEGFADLQDSMGEINDLFNHIRHTGTVAQLFPVSIGTALEPCIERMQTELERKLEQFEIGDLGDILENGRQ